MALEKIRNGSETNTTLRIDLDKFIPGSNQQLVIFVSNKENGKAKHRQTILDEFLEIPLTNS